MRRSDAPEFVVERHCAPVHPGVRTSAVHLSLRSIRHVRLVKVTFPLELTFVW
jgi:hypothetical protein